MMGRCSKRVPREAASVAAPGEPSRTTTAIAKPQQGGMMVAASQALVPHDPFQGRGQAHSGGRSARGHEIVGAPADGDSASQEGPIEGVIRASPRARARGAGGAFRRLRDVAATSARRRGVNVPRRAART
jgi:hypothetical protein